MKGVSLLSGGKDSYLSLLIAVSIGINVEKTITVEAETDSIMFHYQNAYLGAAVSEMMGIENMMVREDQFEDFIKNFRGYYLIAGAVESEFQKTRLEAVCETYGMIPFLPLWRKRNDLIIEDFINSGTKGIFVSVAAEGLGENLLGKDINECTLGILLDLREKFRISLIGEGGEYETLVTEIPFSAKCLKILNSKVIDRGIQKNLQIIDYELVNLQ